MQRVATDLYNALLECNARVEPVILRTSWRWTHVRTGLFLGSSLFRIAAAAKRGKMDAVLFSSMVTASLTPLLQRTLRKHGVASGAIVHGRDATLLSPPYQFLVPRIFAALDAVFPVSRATGAACLERGLAQEKLHVVRNGVSPDRFAADWSRATARTMLFERFGPPEGAAGNNSERVLLLCSAGRQVKRKGFAWFVEQVLPRLPEDVHYWLAGEGPEAERILRTAERSGVAHRVRLLGRLSHEELEGMYRAADLFIMPNVPVPGDMEGFGVVMLEAGLCGLPTVAADIEGIADVIEDGKNGRLVRSGDAEGFSEAILAYRREPEMLEKAGRRTVSHVLEHFGWNAAAEKYLRVLEACSIRRRAPA
ncbi:MAG: glycosyltransferase family 4 protein [Bacteroidetes bacterium SB0662_bin_6]|nr:glycosyltransferase family 4 protein [Bacteroidetes bacterium SB0668_bin_1]MYE05555.1 glycosyltransferase family 4 protein [Bacteroidetes bacterium SB0662_bin_6]